ncbi:MAG: hypothetical protein FWC26_08925 [Fibromonadales bacterium]|nr:hypothetical protein [Fibromonadales bacterium]
MRNSILTFLLLLAAIANAAQTLAVLEITQAGEINASIPEIRHLSDELRRQAVATLPDYNYTVLTRDNIISLMPPDEKEAECLAESCAVEIGRAIGAEYISQGSIGNFGGDLSLSIELYETLSGKLLGSIVIESKDVKGLMDAIRKQAPALFAKIKSQPKQQTQYQPAQQPPADKYAVNYPPSFFASQKTKTSTWVAVGLDILGAAAIGFGIYQHINASTLYNDYKKMEWLSPEEHGKYEDARKKANDAKTLRNMGYAIGSVLLGTGIAIHIWF